MPPPNTCLTREQNNSVSTQCQLESTGGKLPLHKWQSPVFKWLIKKNGFFAAFFGSDPGSGAEYLL